MIPLNEDAIVAIKALYTRASAIGGTHPDHFVFLACANGSFDPTKPQKELAFGVAEFTEGRRNTFAALP